ncbi:excinuclease ABC subunit C [Halobacterium jilantaiense]|uniref:UvrABC system protein C n=1 Tax=Halobacterium jilantaiense TaxID=355548 RepID=A0A1I0PPW1_9EURY|nr:excinuclease ABC subunit C [Halobacterium jilantaiense]SEW16417.1 Excinuclease ABC subunit C [Halobacterium jilantaiense]
MDADEVRERASDLPAEPGVYQFVERPATGVDERASDARSADEHEGDSDGERDLRGGDGTVLYVGKAVDVRDRVRSYADPRSGRIARMVERADDLAFAVTDTETQALLLEANLVKRHQPRYNVRLKDDKSYPLVQFTAHDAPRIEVTRDPDPGAAAFGPYTDKGRVETVVKAIREVYGLRGCSEHKYRNRERPCLDYEMGLCTAPCTGEISEADYRADVESARRFFEGETGALADPIRREMERAAQDQQFERAANLRDRLDVVEGFHDGAGAAVAAGGDDSAATTDVLGVAVEGDAATVARLHAEHGQLVERDQHRLDAPEDTEHRVGAVLAAFLAQYYAERELPDRILLPEPHGDDEVAAWLAAAGVEVTVPGAGRDATLVDLALKNAHRRSGSGDELGALADALGVSRPERIEGFDVSHAQGKAVVGSDVCFVGGSAETADYRRKKLDDENDDYANMRRLLRWRAERAVEAERASGHAGDDRPDPDLLLIDGGRGQLDAALDAVDDVGWDGPEAVVALAKDEEVVVTANRTYDWDSDAPQLHVLQRVRDEAHRFAVAYHQSLRDEVSTALDGVEGVGPALRKRLLRRFGSVEGVRQASVDDLRTVEGVGEATAETIASRL